MEYTAPDVYIEDVKSSSQPISQLSSSTGAMLGATRSGKTGSLQLVTSWSDFISKYANGLDTPFLENSYLPYAVYGFFINGGSKLYVGRVVSNSASFASAEGTVLRAEAISEGSWANDLSIEIVKSEDYDDGKESSVENLEFDVIVTLGNSDSTKITGVYIDTIVDSILKDSKAGKWLGDVSLVNDSALSEETIELAGGVDGVNDLKDSDYIDALTMLDDFVDEITLISVPGVETNSTRDAVLSYCDKHKRFPIISVPVGSTAEEVRAYRKKISSDYGALPYPWGCLTDPLTGKDKLIPPEGHYMGVCSRIIESRGAFKAPAGTEATIRGFNDMETVITKEISGLLNPLGVVCLMTRPNYGICVWGARGLNSSDPKMRYVSDHLLNIKIRRELYAGTMFAMFEPNDEPLWKRCYTTCANYLEKLRAQGAFKGSGEGDAWYVVCDESNNTKQTIEDGYLYIDIGYAPVKPAEFVVIRLAHSIDAE